MRNESMQKIKYCLEREFKIVSNKKTNQKVRLPWIKPTKNTKVRRRKAVIEEGRRITTEQRAIDDKTEWKNFVEAAKNPKKFQRLRRMLRSFQKRFDIR